MTEDIGSSIRRLREALGWSQYQLAKKVPISQKQMSRIENHQVIEIPRATLIRLAEVLHTPLMTGEVNRWLYLGGYRPLIHPNLPLPPNADTLLARFNPYPAAVLDVAGHLSACNPAMENLFSAFSLDLPIGQSVVPALCRPTHHQQAPMLSSAEVSFIVRRLLLEWSLYSDEEGWIVDAKRQLARDLGELWDYLSDTFRPDAELLTPWPAEFVMNIPLLSPRPRFIITEVLVSRRPDLGLYVLYPMNDSAKTWCLTHSPGRAAAT